MAMWAEHDPGHKVAVTDAQGLLGARVRLSQRTCLRLKAQAVSDLVTLRNPADGLRNDLFKSLGDASEAYLKRFTKELTAPTARRGLGMVVIFHDTVRTHLPGFDHPSEGPEKFVQNRFWKLGCCSEAHGSIHCKGTRTSTTPQPPLGLSMHCVTTPCPWHP